MADDRSVASNDNSINPSVNMSSSNSVSKYNSSSTSVLGGGKYPPAIPEGDDEDDHISRHVSSAKKPPVSSSSSTANAGGNYGSSSSSSNNRQSLNLTPAEDKKFSASQLYRDMKARLLELENAVLASAEIVDFEKNKCKEIVTENTTLIHSLQSEIIGLQSDLKEVNDRYNQVSATNSSLQLQINTKDHEIFNLQQGMF